MAEKPILFSGEMVRAILDGRKTQTRRVIKFPLHRTWDTQIDMHQEVASVNRDGGGNWVAWSPAPMTDEQTARLYPNADGFPCPYGRPGDLLWVRETWQKCEMCRQANCRANDLDGECWHCGEPLDKWKPSIFMPRWASRITLEVTAVRVERVQDISPQDCQDEGLPYDSLLPATAWRESFAELWDSINAKRGYGWDVNPFVWVVEFKLNK